MGESSSWWQLSLPVQLLMVIHTVLDRNTEVGYSGQLDLDMVSEA